jgi:PBP1b-binding outer membrane lipoprotein LpoB
MKKHLLAVCASALILSACGKETIVKEVLVTTPPVEVTEAPETDVNKFDAYLELLYSNSAQARNWDEADLLELGTIVCETFDDGGTLDQVLTVFSNNSTGKYDDELYSAVVAGAVMFLCPEWADYVQSQI